VLVPPLAQPGAFSFVLEGNDEDSI